MKITVAVTVTAGHIAAGRQYLPNCCPLALAIRAAYPGAKDFSLSVGVDEVTIYSADSTESGTLPASAMEFIQRFDGQFSRTEPFAFELELKERSYVPFR
jgi:hypothetical protein